MDAASSTDALKSDNDKSKMPVIGIVPSQNPTEQMVCFPERYVRAIVRSHAAPLLLPISGDSHVYETLFPLIDGFVLTGGNDIDPARYGAVRDSGKISEHSPEREELEYLILSYAHRLDLPVLGICRGMQMINVCLGGTLYRDLQDQFEGVRRPGYSSDCDVLPKIRHWQDPPFDLPSHIVDIKQGSRLARVLKARQINVNSIHHQGICDVSPAVDAVAFGPDGLVEAIEVKDSTFIMGVQWHPEFFGPQEHRMQWVFDALTNVARKSRSIPRGNVAISHSEEARLVAHWPNITFAEYI